MLQPESVATDGSSKDFDLGDGEFRRGHTACTWGLVSHELDIPCTAWESGAKGSVTCTVLAVTLDAPLGYIMQAHDDFAFYFFPLAYVRQQLRDPVNIETLRALTMSHGEPQAASATVAESLAAHTQALLAELSEMAYVP